MYDLIYMWNLKKAKLRETESRLVVARGWGVREMRRHWSKGTSSLRAGTLSLFPQQLGQVQAQSVNSVVSGLFSMN